MSDRNITIKRGICYFLINQNLRRHHIDKDLGLWPSQLPSVTVRTLVGETETQPHMHSPWPAGLMGRAQPQRTQVGRWSFLL